jgi:hypothetical protein
MKSEKLQGTLLDLYKKYSTYISPKELNQEFKSAITGLNEDITVLGNTGKIKERVEQFAEAKIGEFIQAINISFLAEISGETVGEVYSGEVGFSKLCLSKNPEYNEIQRILRNIYVLVESNQKYREKSHHYLGIIKHASSYVKSCDKAFEGFVNSIGYMDKKEKKDLHTFISIDLKSCLGVLDNIKSDLISIGEIISSRHNLLMRTESSIRLLSKYAEIDKFGNVGQSRNHTIERGGGFDIEET